MTDRTASTTDAVKRRAETYPAPSAATVTYTVGIDTSGFTRAVERVQAQMRDWRPRFTIPDDIFTEKGRCICAACQPDYRLMRACATCGYKRCPGAADHRNTCTGSNEPGQPGSLYADPPTNQEDDPMPDQTRHDELKALLSKISEESVTTSNVLADLLDLLRDRLPEQEVPEVCHCIACGENYPTKLGHDCPTPDGKPEPAEVTEDQPVGTRVVDCDGDVWERGEDGCRLWDSGEWLESGGTFKRLLTWTPLRLASPADLARVGIEDEPAPADDLPGDRRVNVTITDVYAAPDEHGFLRINVGPEGATIDPDASNVVVTDVEPAPADDGLAEWERELFRPATCCGKCPPIAGGGYDCTCDGNPRCAKADTPEEWHAEPAPADDLPGEPVEPGDLRAGDKVAFTWWGVEHSTCTLVSVAGGSILRADANDAGDRGIPYVVIRGEWAGGISDVRLIERAPREDDDSAFDNAMRTIATLEARAKKAEAERDEWREVAARYADWRDKWQAKWRESDEARERAEAERDEWKARHEALREDVETRWAFVDDNFLKDILHSILKGDDERAKGEQR